jgi:cyclic beta-1,2-glucan synthetase
MWGRSGFYQSGGAYGFRDQLQDAMALVHAAQRCCASRCCAAAGRQFRRATCSTGGIRRSGRGVRTHCSDDYCGCPTRPAATSPRPRRHRRARRADAPSSRAARSSPRRTAYYDLPQCDPPRTRHLYEHCVRAIEHGLRFGEHGLPLMGSGDWNDGMNLVGARGGARASGWRSSSTMCSAVSPRWPARNDADFAPQCLRRRAQLRATSRRTAGTAQWYRRAYFDDGTPLGSAANDECRIDSICPELVGALGRGDPGGRAGHGVGGPAPGRRDAGLIQLFDPPFDNSTSTPATSRATCPACARTAGSTPTPPSGQPWPLPPHGRYAERAWELFGLINPVHHGDTTGSIAIPTRSSPMWSPPTSTRSAPHTGRGGWTWYTGSAGWMYRLILESLWPAAPRRSRGRGLKRFVVSRKVGVYGGRGELLAYRCDCATNGLALGGSISLARSQYAGRP